MKQAKILLFSLTVLTMLFTGGCADSSASDGDLSSSYEPTNLPMEEALETPKHAASATDAASETPGPTPYVTPDICVSVDYSSDELLSKYDSFDEFVESEDEIINKIVLMTSIALRDFKFIDVGYKIEENHNISYFENKVLYSTDELLPEKPLVVAVGSPGICPGVLPTKGIEFVDESNTTRCFVIMQSGNDGSLFLVEF